MNRIESAPSRSRRLASWLRAFLGEVPGSIRDHLNTRELVRIALTSLAAGGGLLGLLQAVVLASGSIFPSPADASLAAAVLTLILEACRRLDHGDPPSASRPALRRRP